MGTENRFTEVGNPSAVCSQSVTGSEVRLVFFKLRDGRILTVYEDHSTDTFEVSEPHHEIRASSGSFTGDDIMAVAVNDDDKDDSEDEHWKEHWEDEAAAAKMLSNVAAVINAKSRFADKKSDLIQRNSTLDDNTSSKETAYDCDVKTLPTWCKEKTAWCCKHKGLGCRPAYDCRESSTAASHWSSDHSAWCCEHKHVGCPATLPRPAGDEQQEVWDCYSGPPVSWSQKKQEWCCREKALNLPEYVLTKVCYNIQGEIPRKKFMQIPQQLRRLEPSSLAVRVTILGLAITGLLSCVTMQRLLRNVRHFPLSRESRRLSLGERVCSASQYELVPSGPEQEMNMPEDAYFE